MIKNVDCKVTVQFLPGKYLLLAQVTVLLSFLQFLTSSAVKSYILLKKPRHIALLLAFLVHGLAYTSLQLKAFFPLKRILSLSKIQSASRLGGLSVAHGQNCERERDAFQFFFQFFPCITYP